MQLDPGDGLLASLGLKLVNLIVGAIGSFVSLRFFDGLSTLNKWTTFVGGWSLAAWGGEPLTAVLGLTDKAVLLFVLLLSFFGMALVAEVIKLIKCTDWGGLLREIVETVLRIKRGGDK